MLWIARDKGGDLYIYTIKPDLLYDYWFRAGNGVYLKIDKSLYPQITFENSPREIVGLCFNDRNRPD